MMSFIIYDFWISVSSIYLAIGSSDAGSFSYLFNDATSMFFFLMSSSVAFMFEGSYPTLSTRFSKDWILVSFANEETFSNFNCD